MLKSLLIENVALIDRAEINFKSGLNVLSGETGSGKSVILEALNFVLGAKADKTLIKSGKSECHVDAYFDVSNVEEIDDAFNEFGFDVDNEILISRRFSADGKSSVKLNGNSVTQSMLRKFTSKLVDVHGQSEHFYLLKNSNQLELIDKFVPDTVPVKNEIIALFKEYRDVKKNIDSLGGSDADRLVKIDILNFQIKEIESANLKEGEEEELLSVKKILNNQSKIVNALASVKAALNGDGGVGDVVSNADKILSTITEFSDSYSKLSERLSAVNYEISDIADSVSSELEDFNYSEYNPEEIEERLDLIKNLKRKYGGTVLSVLSFLDEAKKQLEIYQNFNVLSADLLKQKSVLEEKIYKQYEILSDVRKRESKVFSDRVTSELKELGMENAVFDINFNDFPSADGCAYTSENGVDEIEFVFSANKGEPVKPLSNIISGGEISRFMLAVKTQTAKFNNISTFIFDEIDSGISGNTAKIVAQKFAKIAKQTQIIAITHLPQIAAMGDANYLIEKTVENGKTLTQVKELNSEEKISEIVRLVGGDKDSKSAKELGMELISLSKEYKGKL